MNNSNTTVAPKSRRKSAANLGNATKASAKDLFKLVLSFREDKKTPGKAVNAMNRVFSTILDSNTMSVDDKKAAMMAASNAAKADADAAIDRQLARGLSLAGIKRGVTAKGGINQADVKTEMFGASGRKQAVENNTDALRSVGMSS